MSLSSKFCLIVSLVCAACANPLSPQTRAGAFSNHTVISSPGAYKGGTRSSPSSHLVNHASARASLLSSNSSGTLTWAPSAATSTYNNSSYHSNGSRTTELDPCYFVVQDTLDARYWLDYTTLTKRITRASMIETSITEFRDTTVTNYRNTTSSVNITTTFVSDVKENPLTQECNHQSPKNVQVIANNTTIYDYGPMPVTMAVEMQGTETQLSGHTIVSPNAVYVYTKVKILSVAHITNDKGEKVCTTTSSPVTFCDGITFSYQNPNVQSYFDLKGGPHPSFSVLEQISFSVPFIYTPPTTALFTEMFGYVPRSLLTWMAQDARYVAQYPQLGSYRPGGPVLSYTRVYSPAALFRALYSASVLKSSTVVSVHSDGCFNPGACPTSPIPGAAVPTITPANTAEPTTVPSPALVVQPSNEASTLMIIPTDIHNSPAVLLSVSSNPYPPIATVPANSAHLGSTQGDLPAGSPVPGKAGSQTPEDDPLNPAETSQVQPANPTASYQPPPQHQALASMILKAIGGSPIVAPNPDINQETGPNKQTAPVYVVSLAPSASAVVVNGITSPMPEPANAGASPIVTINSKPTTLGTVPGLAVDGQNVVAGAPTTTIHGVPVSLAPLATAIVVDGRTTPLSPGQTPIITLGSQPVTASPMSQYVVGGRTLVPGATAITFSGTPISVPTEGNAIVVGGSTIVIPTTAGPIIPMITLGNRVITANSASQFLLGDQTLVPGAPAITVAAPASVIAAFGPSPTALTVGGEVFTPNPTAFSIDGTTISAGGPGVTVDGTSISLGRAGILNVGGSTMSLPVNEVSPTAYTIGGQVFTPNPTAFSIDSTTISAGGPGVTIDGTIVSLGPSGLLRIGSSTISLGLDAASPTPTVYTVGNQVFTPNPTAFLIDGKTISAGGPGVTIDGTIVSLGSSGILDIGSSTISLAPSPAYTVGGMIFTPNPTAFSIDGTIISAGGSGVNIDGTLVSLESSGILDIGSSRILLSPTNVYTVGGETFTANPTAFSIDGTTISAGGPGATIDGTLVSLESSGILDIGSSKILLSPTNVYTVAGETFTANPTAFSIDGTKISAGGPGVTIDGTVISLGTSGTLDIGSSTILLLSGNMDNAGGPMGLATSVASDIVNSTIPLTNGNSASTTSAPGPGPGATSSSTHPRSTHSGGEAHISRPRIRSLSIMFIIGCVIMLR